MISLSYESNKNMKSRLENQNIALIFIFTAVQSPNQPNDGCQKKQLLSVPFNKKIKKITLKGVLTNSCHLLY